MAEYRLTPAAEADLEDIWTYSADTWSIEQANIYTDQLVALFDALAINPQQAAPCDHIRAGYRYARARRHVVYVRQREKGIDIVRVLHDRMLPTSHL